MEETTPSVMMDRPRAHLGRDAKVSTRVYRSGHGARVLPMLAMTVLAVTTIFYELGALERWGRALAVGLAAGVLLISSWGLVWVPGRNEGCLRARALDGSLTDLPNRSSSVGRVDSALTQAARESRSITVLLVDPEGAGGVGVGARAPLRETTPERSGAGVSGRSP
jgi:hypothetical protein